MRKRFSPPKGIQVFATLTFVRHFFLLSRVSVPRRGFRSLLLVGHVCSNPRCRVSVPRRGFRSLLLLSKNLPLTRFSSLLLSFPRLCADLPSISFLTPFSTPKSALLRMKELTLALVFSRFLSSPRFPSISAVLGYLEAPKRHFFEVSYV